MLQLIYKGEQTGSQLGHTTAVIPAQRHFFSSFCCLEATHSAACNTHYRVLNTSVDSAAVAQSTPQGVRYVNWRQQVHQCNFRHGSGAIHRLNKSQSQPQLRPLASPTQSPSRLQIRSLTAPVVYKPTPRFFGHTRSSTCRLTTAEHRA